MTKEEIGLNRLKIGEIVEDKEGELFVIHDVAELKGMSLNKPYKYLASEAYYLPFKTIEKPKRIWTISWNDFVKFQRCNPMGLYTETYLSFVASERTWKTLSAKRKVKIEVEIAEGVNEIEVEGKMVRV